MVLRLILLCLLLAACAGEPSGAPATSTAPPAPDSAVDAAPTEFAWAGTGDDLHGAVEISDILAPGTSGQPDVVVDGEPIGPGLLTVWVDADTPEAIAEIDAADCARLDALLDRHADVLYRRDVPAGHKAQADAYLGHGMERVADLGCDYVIDREGRATPFP